MIKRIFKIFSIVFLSLTSCIQEQDIPVTIAFNYTTVENSTTVPVTVNITNTTQGADFYLWTFEGGSPATSNLKLPGPITYENSGTYSIKLEAWNDQDRKMQEIALKLDAAVTLDFVPEIIVNDFSPVTVHITNNIRDAESYEWTFAGGTPATSSAIDPPDVVFTDPGDHIITLRIGNGTQFFSSSQTITVKPPLQPYFTIVPSFEDQDLEAPFTATLTNTTISGLTYHWSATSGSVTNPDSENASISFPNPGTYSITLEADNEKETKTSTQNITIKANTNLYVIRDVKFGVSAAHKTIGSFYAGSWRRVLKESEVTTETSPLIDVVFFGINSSFSYCRFISPDSAADFSFEAITQAKHTYVVNNAETLLSSTAFDAMTTDMPLRSINVQANSNGTEHFTNTQTPRIILFQTHDQRKGAIKIKSFVATGAESYIVADIKIQKQKP